MSQPVALSPYRDAPTPVPTAVGDLVRFRAGGPVMMVVIVGPYNEPGRPVVDKGWFQCKWFDVKYHVQWMTFPGYQLDRVLP